MKIVQTTGIVKNGEIKVKLPQELSDGEVDVIVVAKNEPAASSLGCYSRESFGGRSVGKDEFEELRSSAKIKGYNSKEKILELIGQVKQEMLAEKGRTK